MGNYEISELFGLIKFAKRYNHSYYFYPYVHLRVIGFFLFFLLFLFPISLMISSDSTKESEFFLLMFISFTISIGLIIYGYNSVTILNDDNVFTVNSFFSGSKKIPIKNIRNIWVYTNLNNPGEYGTPTNFYLYLYNDEKIKIGNKGYTDFHHNFDILMDDLSNDLDLKIISKTIPSN